MKRLLVIRFGAMGDLVHTSAALRAVHVYSPGVEIHYLTSPIYAELAARLPHVGKVWTFDKRRLWTEIRRLSKAFREAGIDAVANLQPSFKTWLLCMLIGTRIETYRKEKLPMQGKAQRSRPRRHAMEDFYQPFRRLFNLPEALEFPPRLELPPEPGKTTGETWIGIIPGVGRKRNNRAWPVESWQQLIPELLTDSNTRVFLVGGPDETGIAADIAQAVSHPRLESRCGQLSIPETARLLRQMDMVIGGDTGPLHVAAATNRPVLGIFGPTSVDRTGPRGEHPGIRMLTPPETLDCWPCEQITCPLSGDQWMACMRQIPVEAVLKQVQSSTGPPGG